MLIVEEDFNAAGLAFLHYLKREPLPQPRDLMMGIKEMENWSSPN